MHLNYLPNICKTHGEISHDATGIVSLTMRSLCCQHPEQLDHLLVACVTGREVWFKTLRRSGWQHRAPSGQEQIISWWLRSRKRIIKTRRKAFDSLVIQVVWTIWLERNIRVFRNTASMPAAIVNHIWNELGQYSRAGLVVWAALVPD